MIQEAASTQRVDVGNCDGKQKLLSQNKLKRLKNLKPGLGCHVLGPPFTCFDVALYRICFPQMFYSTSLIMIPRPLLPAAWPVGNLVLEFLGTLQ